MIEVEDENGAIAGLAEALKDFGLPTFCKVLLGLQVLIEEAVFVRNAKEVQNIDDHWQMR